MTTGDVIIYIERPRPDSPLTVCRVEAPFPNVSGDSGFLDGDLQTPETTEPAIRAFGSSLVDWIGQYQVVQQTLTVIDAEGDAFHGEMQFRITDPMTHALPWESFFRGKFWALSGPVGISRLPRGQRPPRDPHRTTGDKLRITCVLSGAALPGLRQWEIIRGAVEKARSDRPSIPIALTLIAAEDDLLAAARDAGGPDTTVHVVPSPNEPTSLLNLIEQSQPHILHILAHGDFVADAPVIRVATQADHLMVDAPEELLKAGLDVPADQRGQVVIAADELGQVAARAGVWCTVLAICAGADAQGDLLTHAEFVVAHGVPATVAIRTQLNLSDADMFTAGWHPALLKEIGDALQAAEVAGTPAPLSFTVPLREARRRLRDKHGADAQASVVWTTPVLYRLPGTLSIEPLSADRGGDACRLGFIDTVGGLIKTLPGDTPHEVFDELLALLPPGTPQATLDELKAVADGAS